MTGNCFEEVTSYSIQQGPESDEWVAGRRENIWIRSQQRRSNAEEGEWDLVPGFHSTQEQNDISGIPGTKRCKSFKVFGLSKLTLDPPSHSVDCVRHQLVSHFLVSGIIARLWNLCPHGFRARSFARGVYEPTFSDVGSLSNGVEHRKQQLPISQGEI